MREMGRRGIHPGPHRLRQEQSPHYLGHAVSEDPGMRYAPPGSKTFITEVPIEWIRWGTFLDAEVASTARLTLSILPP